MNKNKDRPNVSFIPSRSWTFHMCLGAIKWFPTSFFSDEIKRCIIRAFWKTRSPKKKKKMNENFLNVKRINQQYLPKKSMGLVKLIIAFLMIYERPSDRFYNSRLSIVPSKLFIIDFIMGASTFSLSNWKEYAFVVDAKP